MVIKTGYYNNFIFQLNIITDFKYLNIIFLMHDFQ